MLIEAVKRGVFEIDAEGHVWRRARRGIRRAEHRTPAGYLQVRWMTGGVRYYAGAHRLVWQHFNGDIPLGHEINHDNGLKDDNRPRNLVCGSGGENMKHAHAGGLRDQAGEKNPAAKLTDNQVAQIRLAYAKGGHTMEQLGVRFGVSFKTISKIVRGQRRAKQGGPVQSTDQRHCATARDPVTQRFAGRTWDEMPKARG